jgi:hypothetical protein
MNNPGYRAGEREHARYRLQAGSLAHRYILARKAEGIDRAAAVAEIAAQLPDATRQAVNQMVGAFQVATVLGEGLDLTDVGFFTLRLCIPLLDRDSQTEGWSIRPGIEAEARALFRRIAEEQPALSCKVIGIEVKRLLARQARAVARKLVLSADEDSRLEAQAVQALERAGKAEAKARRAEQPPIRTRERLPGTDPKVPIYSPLAAAKQSQPRDLAASLAAQLKANRNPREVLEHFARLVNWQESDGVAFACGLLASTARGAEAAAVALCIHVQDNLEETAGQPVRNAAKVA